MVMAMGGCSSLICSRAHRPTGGFWEQPSAQRCCNQANKSRTLNYTTRYGSKSFAAHLAKSPYRRGDAVPQAELSTRPCEDGGQGPPKQALVHERLSRGV
ncbi:hypothetical protein PGT21_030439 [Puccinia graminis f. sp. tritici]|uniref:Uncharacterized protein n=1 Tax=Puccinia graminis f. sp. tritici TaxID=56615 RepID=A0A5B0Q3Y4_PUCGR|nr:hypothetical protein PGT21_030439 [Puccinia graminis f. sp. tritici]KAA1107995.1 hypothetical protein PGTUg99_021429 [Puccinia graminis f. sp. tritici]